jgi:hypothetical protein
MVQPVTLDTVQRYAVNAGMMVVDVDFSKVTDAAAFVQAVATAKDKWLGATSGTTTISENRENWSPDHNGLRMPWKGAQWLDTAQPSIKATLVEMTAENIGLASGAIEKSTTGNITTIKPKTTYALTDYHTITWFTNYGTDGIIAVTLKNALCTTGLNWKIDDKAVATCDVEFLGHADDPIASDYLPIEYMIYKSASGGGGA